LWALSSAIVGLAIPTVLLGAEHNGEMKTRKFPAGYKDYSKQIALLYMILSYAIGIFFMLLPDIYQKNIRGYNEKEFI
jgi:hypothetical protein